MTENIYLHQSDVGTEILITVLDFRTNLVVDLSSASTIKFLFQDPDGNTFSRDGELYTDGLDGIVKYKTVEGDIDQSGKWEMQCYVTTSNGTYYTRKTALKVYSVIEVDD